MTNDKARPTIQAIETRYKGYRFRSRLEARWAVFLDSFKVQWEYEKEGFDLPEFGYYLPDFWLPKFNMWLEIKPTYPSDEEWGKVRALRDHTYCAALLFYGLPIERFGVLSCWDLGDSSGGSSDWIVLPADRGCGLEFLIHGQKLLDKTLYSNPGMSIQIPICTDIVAVDYADAVHGFAAKSARFEHGESGAR